MFFRIDFNWDQSGVERLLPPFHILLETANEKRCRMYIDQHIEEASNYTITCEALILEDNEIPPDGYTYQKQQVWVEGSEPADGGWCRIWTDAR